MPFIPFLALPGSLCRNRALPFSSTTCRCLGRSAYSYAPDGINYFPTRLPRSFLCSSSARQLATIPKRFLARVSNSNSVVLNGQGGTSSIGGKELLSEERNLVKEIDAFPVLAALPDEQFHSYGNAQHIFGPSRQKTGEAKESRESGIALVLQILRRHTRLYEPFNDDIQRNRRSRDSPLWNVPQKEKPLCSLLGRYIDITASSSAPPVFEFTTEELTLLRSRGYDGQSVEQWASSLLNRNSYSASAFFCPGDRKPPIFVLLILLQRTHVGYSALRMLLEYAQTMIHTKEVGLKINKDMLTLLLYHARREWPESLPFIADLLTEGALYTSTDVQEAGFGSAQYVSELTALCNNFLVQFSGTVRLHPVLSSIHQAKAQFHVLRYMDSKTPALTVTRDGFRAIAKVQAAHRKTIQENEWTQLKAGSWPPWKANRTAMDEEMDSEHGISRAGQIIKRMHEAGYTNRTWERVLQIHAGWDTDGSPTVQQRTALPDFPFRSTSRIQAQTLEWAARIRATRTQREAWACFLAYEASGIPPNHRVYYAIFERIFRREVQSTKWHPNVKQRIPFAASDGALQPGDSKEIWPEPSSTQDLTYIKEPLPSCEQLIDRMMRKGVQPSSRLLAFILDISRDFRTTIRILTAQQDTGLQRLLDMDQADRAEKLPVPSYLFAAFIRFLCRFGRFTKYPEHVDLNMVGKMAHKDQLESSQQYRIEYAYTLLLRYRPQYRPAWTAYMAGILNSRKKKTTGPMAIAVYRIIWDLVAQMDKVDLEPDEEQFQILCNALEYAIRTAAFTQQTNGSARWLLARREACARNTRLLFSALVGFNSSATLTPLRIPGPAVLHAYVRALGVLHDYEGLYSFSSWITSHYVEVTARANTQHSGLVMLRRTLTALRMYLELSWENGQPGNISAPADLIELVKKQVNDVPSWGGWPTEYEVQLYVNQSN
ncbi:hypothetical protein GQ43DRAFT_424316 [Delitschia confertaspora ATCC 74209]|uniref:Uncharacterized protein n=1 Tax=Delitschia confertaspora ATCC 74209 TaxID=1513339 RepID=A0A9P4MNV5_9PLEO|nr:hypothetical protein GQ43DRAFT_424316 [Delitschia confertaspora ATCC 74209]